MVRLSCERTEVDLGFEKLQNCRALRDNYFLYRTDGQSTDLNHGVDVALGARELRGILHLDEHDEVEIVPHVVLGFTVLLKRHRLVVEG